jgi:hypothetical protein
MRPNQERKYQELYMQTRSLALTMMAEPKMIISDMMKQAPRFVPQWPNQGYEFW